MKSNSYNPKLTLVENALNLAEKYEKAGDKKKAEHYLKVAEKIEQVMKRNRETMANITKTKESK